MGSGEVEKLWKTASFTKRILNFIFDEGHCISQWGTFRKEYLNLGQLCYLILERIPFYVALTTLPLPILLDVVDILKIRLDQAEQILRSNDRPEISLLVRGLTFSAKSFQDLAFLIPEGFRTGDSVKPFLVFFDTKSDAQNACKAMRKRLPRATGGSSQNQMVSCRLDSTATRAVMRADEGRRNLGTLLYGCFWNGK